MIIATHIILHTKLQRLGAVEEIGILLLKRNHTTGNNPGYWSCVGGTVEAGEEFKSCAVRELKEENQISCDIDFDWPLNVDVLATKENSVRFYTASFMPHDIGSLKGSENTGYAIFLPEELKHITICPEHRLAIEAFLRN